MQHRLSLSWGPAIRRPPLYAAGAAALPPMIHGLEVAADGLPAIPDGVFEALPGAWMPPFPARTEPGFQCPPVLLWKTLAHVIAIAVRGLVLQGGQAALRRRRLLRLAEVGLGAG
jgi:hypothetical protein